MTALIVLAAAIATGAVMLAARVRYQARRRAGEAGRWPWAALMGTVPGGLVGWLIECLYPPGQQYRR